jgi:hypothetical protein
LKLDSSVEFWLRSTLGVESWLGSTLGFEFKLQNELIFSKLGIKYLKLFIGNIWLKCIWYEIKILKRVSNLGWIQNLGLNYSKLNSNSEISNK